MSLGLAQDLAAFVAAELGVGLYDDPDITNRVVFVQFLPPVPEELDADDYGTETKSPLTIALFEDGGAEGTLNLSTPYNYTVQVRHSLYETALQRASEVNDALHQNGGTGTKLDARGKFGDNRVVLITANFPPQPLGRDPAPRDGRMIITQTFTVLAMAPTRFS